MKMRIAFTLGMEELVRSPLESPIATTRVVVEIGYIGASSHGAHLAVESGVRGLQIPVLRLNGEFRRTWRASKECDHSVARLLWRPCEALTRVAQWLPCVRPQSLCGEGFYCSQSDGFLAANVSTDYKYH